MSEPVNKPGHEAAEAKAWLDGVAGRPGEGPAHADGQRLRDALTTTVVAEMPPWTEIEKRAGLDASSSPHDLNERPDATAAAANEARWKPWAAAAAVFGLATVLVAIQWQPAAEVDAGQMRGGAAAGTDAAPVWLVPQPQSAAGQLAQELTALGAQVETSNTLQGVVLNITAPASAVRGVNERLAQLETALDAQGRLSLRVTAPQPPVAAPH